MNGITFFHKYYNVIQGTIHSRDCSEQLCIDNFENIDNLNEQSPYF